MKLRRSLLRHGIALRMMFAVLCLTLLLNGVANVAHHHSVESGSVPGTHAALCGWCSAFGGMAATPDAPVASQSLTPFVFVALLSVAAPLLRRQRVAARPRAPPAR